MNNIKICIQSRIRGHMGNLLPFTSLLIKAFKQRLTMLILEIDFYRTIVCGLLINYVDLSSKFQKYSQQ